MYQPVVQGQNRQRIAFSKSASVKSVNVNFRKVQANGGAVVIEAPVKLADDVADKCVNAIRFLAIDGVNKANSGHPGAPMGLAPISYLLWGEIMNYNPKNPYWVNRDRFVLSAGHASMLIYSMLYLTGYDSVKLDDLKQFRQLGSVTPGHPENFETPGVEVTTGPLGQGISNAVGLAAAQAHLAARFNKPDCEPLFDHYTYAIAGDGCMMEGVSNEACSLAGHWGLGNLIAFYDSNQISIDGHTDISFTEDVAARYVALGWHVQTVENGNTDLEGMRKAVEAAKQVKDKPSLIVICTLIGYGSPNKANSHDVHGAPLGADETKATRDALGWPYGEFEVPEEAAEYFKKAGEKGADTEAKWEANFKAYCEKYPEEGAELKGLLSEELPEGWEKCLPTFDSQQGGKATRQHSNSMLQKLGDALPGFLGGSADLAPSNLTLMNQFGDFQKATPAERNLRFGVREFGMGAICNGIALYKAGLIPYCATFFIFTDYMRSAIRMAALSQAGVIYVMTHDSIGLGEDGPTHQPIEHLAGFRAMPNILMMRPCGGNETAGAYKVAVQNRKRPTILALSRQGMPNIDGCTIEGVEKGGYVVKDCEGTPELIVMGTGSELQNADEAYEKLTAEGKKVRLVSMVCCDLFDEQSEEYKESVLPADVTNRVSIEAGSTYGWERYVGPKGKAMGINRFGASAPGGALYKKFGLTTDDLVETCQKLL